MIIKLDMEEARTLQDLLFTVGYQDICSGKVMKSKRMIERGQLATRVAEQIKVQRRLVCPPQINGKG